MDRAGGRRACAGVGARLPGGRAGDGECGAQLLCRLFCVLSAAPDRLDPGSGAGRMMIPDRLLAFSLVAAVLALSWAGLAWRSWRFRRRTAADLLVNSRPLVLAFSTPDCVPCQSIQKPALEELQRRSQDRVKIREVDVLTRPERAGRFGVLSVPVAV